MENSLHIYYSFSSTPFGKVIIASTERGLCYLSFCEPIRHSIEILKRDGHSEIEGGRLDELKEVAKLQEKFSTAILEQGEKRIHLEALKYFFGKKEESNTVPLDLYGTTFQLEVWKLLQRIPYGSTTTYGDLAEAMGKQGGARAVGTAVGANPIAGLIPCHRVVQTSGKLGGYRWGLERKKSLLQWERFNLPQRDLFYAENGQDNT